MRKDLFTKHSLYYELDRNDRIAAVGWAWNYQAESTGAAKLSSDKVFGSKLSNHFQDEGTWLTTKSLIDRARDREAPMAMAYRMDTVRATRDWVMILGEGKDDTLRIAHYLISSVERAVNIDVVGGKPRRPVVDRCSFCNRLYLNNAWVDPFKLGVNIEATSRYMVCAECEEIALIA